MDGQRQLESDHYQFSHHYPVSMLIISMCLCFGMSIAVLLPFLPPLYSIVVALIVSCLLCLSGRTCFVLPGWCVLGFCWAVIYYGAMLNQWLPTAQENQEIEIAGYVMDFPQKRERGWQFDFYADQLDGKVRLSVYGQGYADTAEEVPAPRLDCHYRFLVKLKRPRGLLNFGLYDYQAWLLQSGYVATGYVRAVLSCEQQAPALLLGWRAGIADKINQVAVSDYAKSTLLALLIGSYADIDTNQWQVLRNSGTIHLLSVSGLHIVLVAALAHFCFFHLAKALVFPVRWLPAEFFGSISALFFAVFYAFLAGFSVATQRALIMVAVAVLQRLLYGKFMFGTAFMLALLLVLMSNPLSVLSCGFWFSFWGTWVLLVAMRGESSRTSLSFLQKLEVFIRPQWLLFVLLSPMLLYVYGRMPLLSLPLNFLAVPWVSFLSLPLAFAALLVLPFSHTLGSWLLQASAWTVDVYWSVMQAGVAVGKDYFFDLGGIGFFPLLMSLSGLSMLCLMRARWLWRLAGLLLCVPLAFSGFVKLQPGELQLTVLDVGQGLSVLVRTAKHVLVYDAGDRRSEHFDAGRDIVAPSLRHQRIDHVGMLMLTHSDSDHAGGAAGLMEEFPVRQLWSGTPERLQLSTEFFSCRAGMHWRWDAVDFRILHPADDREEKGNNRGCVVMIDTGRQRVLLTADIELPAEKKILQRGADVKADILVSPHHGSKSSSSSALLEAVQAKWVVVSAGFNNRYKHPSPEVVKRYREREMNIFNTADSGAIRFTLSNNGVDVESALCDNRRFWRNASECPPFW
jgi:competence protein ComEC